MTLSSTPPPPSSSSTTPPLRFRESQQNQTLIHPLLPQPSVQNENKDTKNINTTKIARTTTSEESSSSYDNDNNNEEDLSYNFIVCSDTQLGMTNDCDEWETEIEYSRQAVNKINNMPILPKFCCICGDLIHMETSFYTAPNGDEPPKFTEEECNVIQRKQFDDFKDVWSKLHDDIALVCLCGNHGTF